MMILEPNLQAKVWGGGKLKKLKNLPDFDESLGGLGETWEISCHPDGPSTFHGQAINKFIDIDKLPYLVKFIDTSSELSIQVHPGDDYAKAVEQSKGKTECWLILAHEKGAGIYLGLKPGVTKDDLKIALAGKSSLDHYLNFCPVQVGDFFYVPAGTIHAIGKGVTLAEIQQSSGITYRVWDWNRLGIDGKPRELHIDKSLDVINFEDRANILEHFRFCNERSDKKECLSLVSHQDFRVDRYHSDQTTIKVEGERYHAIVILEGCAEVVLDGEAQKIESYQSMLILEGYQLEVNALDKDLRFLHIY